jgi:SAM-dependent methyltransferase
MKCEVCGSTFGDLVLNLGNHPLCDDLAPIGTHPNAEEFPQRISLCEECLTAHQTIPVRKEILFKPTYHYRASLTKDVLDGMASLAEDLGPFIRESKKSAVVLDIGCNDGSLLGIFKELYSCTTVGVDPTGAILESGDKVDHKYNGYFDAEILKVILENHGQPDLITFTNVFAHIEDLPGLIRNLKALIGKTTTLVIENHYLGSILERNQFDTFYHEHPRTYSLRSFKFIAESLGMFISDVKFPARYGGNIRVTFTQNGHNANLDIYEKQEELFVSQFIEMQNVYDKWKINSRSVLDELSRKGKFYGKALPGRAVMLINSLEIDEQTMPVLFEQPASPKVGNYVPGTRIEILSDELISELSPQVLIIWSWHIVDEIVKYLDQLGFKGEIWVPLPEFRLYREAL